jgi:uncharacterized membrane protein (DUF2068 family)
LQWYISLNVAKDKPSLMEKLKASHSKIIMDLEASGESVDVSCKVHMLMTGLMDLHFAVAKDSITANMLLSLGKVEKWHLEVTGIWHTGQWEDFLGPQQAMAVAPGTSATQVFMGLI